MRAVFGLLLVMLGLAMAVVWMPEHHGERQLAVVTDIATKGVTRIDGDRQRTNDDKAGRTFSPHTPLLATVEMPGRVTHTAGVARVAPVAAPVDAGAGRTTSATLATATATIIEPTFTVAPVVRPMDGTPAKGPGSDMSRDDLVRSIQRELKRVGCYWGDVDGDWGTGSRRAMGAFTDRVNASLPIDKPDFILLTLLRGHNATACGKGCPTGQALSENGRCIANPVVARRSNERRVAAAATTDAEPAKPERNGGWSAHVVTAAPLRAAEPAPAVQAPGPGIAIGAAVAAVAVLSPPVQPLPGRMAVGAPSSGSGSSYVTNPPERSPARDAVRSSDDAAPAARSAARDRGRGATTARRGPSVVQPRYAYRGPPVMIHRPSPPRSYASAPPRRSASRAWTATFFNP